MAQGSSVQQPRKLEKVERIEAVRDGGYFPVLIRLTNGTLAAVVRGGIGARHMGPGGRLDLITSRDGGRVTLQVPKAQASQVTSRLLADLPVIDLTIEDPPIEDVIEHVFTDQPTGLQAE